MLVCLLVSLLVSVSHAQATLSISSGGTYCQVREIAGLTCATDGSGSYGNYERCTINAVSYTHLTLPTKA